MFKNIVGNDSLKALIGTHIKNKTYSHAYIIEGKKGSGKRTLAKEICKALCCEHDSDELPCNTCRACRRIDSNNNTDIYVLKRDDKASIQVKEVRQMTETMGYYPDDGEVKIYIIEDAETMTPAAQNALLLSLEEPPSYVVFILLTEDAKFLLETVRSRAQILKMETFSASFVADWLKNHPSCKNVSDEAISAYAAASQGALGAALEALTDKSSKSAALSRDAMDLIDALLGDSKAEAVIFAGSLKYSRAEFEKLFDYAIFAIRDLLCVKCGSETTTFFPDTESAIERSSRTKMSKLVRIYDGLIQAKDDITVNNCQVYAVMTTLAAEAV